MQQAEARLHVAAILRTLMIVGLFALLIPTMSWDSSAGQADWCALLDDPNVHMSGGLESALRAYCSGELSAQDVRVNNPATDTAPDMTQSETAIAIFDRNGDGVADQIVSAFNDTGRGPGFFFDVGYSTASNNILNVQQPIFFDRGVLPSATAPLNVTFDPALDVDSAGTYYAAQIDLFAGVEILRMTQVAFPFFTIAPGSPLPGLTFPDREHLVVDNTGGPFEGTIYVATAELATGTIVLHASTNGGATFGGPFAVTPAGGISGFPQAARMAIGPNGELYITWFEFTVFPGRTRNIYVRRCVPTAAAPGPCLKAADWGAAVLVATITHPEDATATVACGRSALNGNIRLWPNPTIAVDRSGGPYNGRVYIVWAADPDGTAAGDDSDIFFTAYDPTLTTNVIPPKVINDDAPAILNDNWGPMIAVTRGFGTVVVAWYDRRLDPLNNLNFDVFKTMSIDGGATFSPNIRVTDVSSPVPPLAPTNFDPGVAVCYMGDYDEMEADDSSIYIQWSDNRILTSGIPDPNVFFEREALSLLQYQDAAGNQLIIDPLGGSFSFTAPGLGIVCNGVPHGVANFSGVYIRFTPCGDDPSLMISAWGRPGSPVQVILRRQGRGIVSVFVLPFVGTIGAGEDALQPLEVAALRTGSGFWFVAQGRPVQSIGVEIYSLSGKLVYDSGWVQGQSLRWTGLSNDGRSVANGVYLYVLTVRDPYGRIIKTEVRKLVLLR